jgi:two-component system chemotaxis sensor kinase CheA
MDKQELAELLTATFVAELDERVQALDHDLLALEQRPTPNERTELLKLLFRSAHSLKGAAHSVSVGVIEAACHSLEEVLTGVRDGRLSLEPQLFALLFSSVDAIREAGIRMREHKDLHGAPLDEILQQLKQAAQGEAVAAEQKPPKVATPPAPAEPASAPPAPVRTAIPLPQPAAASSVRVSAEKLDSLLAQSGELLVARRRVEARAGELEDVHDKVAAWRAEWRHVESELEEWLDAAGQTQLGPQAAATLRRQGQRLRQLEQELEHLTRKTISDSRALAHAGTLLEGEVHRVRMLPFGDGCQALERAVRDLARATGKEVDFILEGHNVEVDRSILEGLRDPLLHLVRNSVDHGVELPAKRIAAGKSPRAKVFVSAALRGSQVAVTVGDDGEGLKLDAIRAQAKKKGIPVPEGDRDLPRLLFLPGFSTASTVTEVSGRGVGLDVVKSQVEALRGSVEVDSLPGRGTRFVLKVPLTLTTIPAALVKSGGQTLAFVANNVQALVRFGPEQVRRVVGRDVLLWHDVSLPIASLAAVLGLPSPEIRPSQKWELAAIVAVGDKRAAFLVDEVLEEQTIVVKSLGARIKRVKHVSGAALLPTGEIALVLNASNLLESAAGVSPAKAITASQAAVPSIKKLLVVEDSVTTRTLVKSILEAHGYDVVTAADGQEAWDRLQELEFDLVVSDVDMPVMDGFALTTAIRGATRLAKLPVILVTAKESAQDKTRGFEVGADAYLIKGAFDQTQLLATIAQLL